MEYNSKADTITLNRLVFAFLGPLILVIVSYHLKLNLVKTLLINISRATVQLILLGYILLGFIFSMKSPLYVVLYLLGMILIASLETLGRQIRTYNSHYLDSLIVTTLSGGLIGMYGLFLIFDPKPWWNPSVAVPTMGMLIGNSVSGPSVGVDRLLSEVSEKRHEVEVRLSFGATHYESIIHAIRSSVLSAIIPNLNHLAILGLVTIPGMMTGQLLAGSSPQVAAQYQMAISYLILTTHITSTYLSVMLALRHAVFDRFHRLTTNRIFKKSEGKSRIDQLLIKLFSRIFKSLCIQVSKFFCCLSMIPWVRRLTFWSSLFKKNDKEINCPDFKQSSPKIIEMENFSSDFDSDEEDDVDDNSIGTKGSDIANLSSNSFSRDEINKDEVSSLLSDKILLRSLRKNKPFRAVYEIVGNSPSQKGINNEIRSKFLDIVNFNAYVFVTVNANEQSVFVNNQARNNIKMNDDSSCYLMKLPLFEKGKGLRLQLHCGEIVTLEGVSGLGKTKFLRALAQLDLPCKGSIARPLESFSHFLTQQESTSHVREFELTPEQIPLWRSRIIYIPQVIQSCIEFYNLLTQHCVCHFPLYLKYI